jgi:C4-dicarboxylate transporter
MIGDIKNGVFVGTAYMTLDIATFKKEMKRISKADLGMRILASYE